VSSPNTPGLRNLQSKKELSALMSVRSTRSPTRPSPFSLPLPLSLSLSLSLYKYYICMYACMHVCVCVCVCVCMGHSIAYRPNGKPRRAHGRARYTLSHNSAPTQFVHSVEHQRAACTHACVRTGWGGRPADLACMLLCSLVSACQPCTHICEHFRRW